MSHPVAAGSNGMRNFSLPSSIQTTYTDAFDFLRRIMRGTVVQKSMGSNDTAEDNGDSRIHRTGVHASAPYRSQELPE